VSCGWYSKQYGPGARSRPKLIQRTARTRHTLTSTLTNKAMRLRHERANRFPQSGDSSGEIARRIHPSGIFPCNFNKFVNIGSGPNRPVPLLRPTSGCAEERRRRGLSCSGHSASRGSCLPDAVVWLQSQTGRKFPASHRSRRRIFTFGCNRLCATPFHAFIASPRHSLRFMIRGIQREW
jgi:hypothetical protein